MGLFDIFNRKNGHSNGVEIPNSITDQYEIPEEKFIEKGTTLPEKEYPSSEIVGQDTGIHVLFAFMERNHESKGYDDALVNPDSSHLEENIKTLQNELMRTIRKVKTFYEDFIKRINFHIGSRSRNGMIDTVEELLMKKSIAEDHISKVVQIENDAKNNEGDSQGILLSYTRGFKNGLAAISHHDILKKKF